MLSPVRMKFSYTIARPADGGVIAAGHTVHAAVSPDGKPCRLPARVREAFA